MDKFWCRGKTPSTEEYFDDGLWTVGYYVCFNGVEHRIYNGYAETDCGDYYPDWDNVIPESVGRYTGETDIHYERIFEGDIVSKIVDGKELKGKVEYADGSFGVRFADGSGQFLCFFANCCEIIGNIFDNPELIEN